MSQSLLTFQADPAPASIGEVHRASIVKGWACQSFTFSAGVQGEALVIGPLQCGSQPHVLAGGAAWMHRCPVLGYTLLLALTLIISTDLIVRSQWPPACQGQNQEQHCDCMPAAACAHCALTSHERHACDTRVLFCAGIFRKADDAKISLDTLTACGGKVAAGWPAEEFAAAAAGALEDGVAEAQTLARVAAARGLPLPA